jgi:hypothetical protein
LYSKIFEVLLLKEIFQGKKAAEDRDRGNETEGKGRRPKIMFERQRGRDRGE